MNAVRDIEQPATIVEAAGELGVTPKTVREWIAKLDVPIVRQGKPGPGNGALVYVSEIRAALARRAGVDDFTRRELELIATALLDTHKRDAGLGRPAHEAIGISERQSAAHLLMAWIRIHRALTGDDPEGEMLPEIAQLHRLAMKPECSD